MCCYDKLWVNVVAYVIHNYIIVVCCYDKILVNVAAYVIGITQNYIQLIQLVNSLKMVY